MNFNSNGIFKSLVLIGSIVSFVSCTGGIKDTSPKTDDEKIVYSIGVDMGSKLETLNLTANELAVLMTGINDGVSAKKPRIDVKAEAKPEKIRALIEARQKVFADKEVVASKSFLEAEAKEAGATKSETGIIYRELTPGNGDSPKATDTVTVHYHGTLRDGTVFDSSKEKNTPATLPLNRVIPCWTEGIQKMKVGGKSILVCPADKAYGDRGAPPVIKPGSALKFEVELISIAKEQAPPAAQKK